MISIHGCPKSLSHLPLGTSLKRYGTNPAGESIYRVIWSESRLHMIGGKWPNGAVEYRWVPRYGSVKAWVLEKWLSAKDYAGSKTSYEISQWDADAGVYPLGPYPERGEFEHCYTFPVLPSDSIIAEHIGMIEAGRKYSTAEKKEAHTVEAEKHERAWMNRAMDIWKDAQGAFNNLPSNVNPGKRTADKINFKYAAEDLKKPMGDGKFFTQGA